MFQPYKQANWPSAADCQWFDQRKDSFYVQNVKFNPSLRWRFSGRKFYPFVNGEQTENISADVQIFATYSPSWTSSEYEYISPDFRCLFEGPTSPNLSSVNVLHRMELFW